MTEGPKAAVPTWRAFKAASIARTLVARHRGQITGIDRLGDDMLPALDAFEAAVLSLRAFEARRQQSIDSHDRALQTLHARTRFWLTYVRLDHTDYQATEFSNYDSADTIIDRARGLLNLADSYTDTDAPYYFAPMRADLAPALEQALAHRADARDQARQEQDQRSAVRHTLVPVSKALMVLRVLLRNALGPTHADVRALALDPPSRRKTREAVEVPATEAATAPTPAAPDANPSTQTAPTTAQRLALVGS